MRIIGRCYGPPVVIPLLCFRCARGYHSKGHGAIGCTEFATVGIPAPWDWICRCEEGRVPAMLPALPREYDEENFIHV